MLYVFLLFVDLDWFNISKLCESHLSEENIDAWTYSKKR